MQFFTQGLAEVQKQVAGATEKAKELAAQASVHARVLAEQASQQAKVGLLQQRRVLSL